MHEDVVGGRSHGDPLPLRRPVNSLGKISSSAAGYLRSRLKLKSCRERRVAEAVTSVNQLSGPAAERASLSDSTVAGAVTATRRACLDSIRRRVSKYPSDPERRSNKQALFQLLKTTDFHSDAESARVSFDEDKLKILGGTAPPREMEPLLHGDALDSYVNFVDRIERTEAEVEAMREAGDLLLPEPYTDPVLRKDLARRLKLFKRFKIVKVP